MCTKSLQSCSALCDSTDCSQPGSSVHGILRVKILECVVMSSSRGSSRPGDQTRVSCGSCTAAGFFTTEPQGKSHPEYMLLLSRFSHVQLCATPEMTAHQAPPVPGILQARTLEWVAISFSSAWKWKVKVKLLSRDWLLAMPWTAAHQAPLSMGFSRQEYWSGVPLPSPSWVYKY